MNSSSFRGFTKTAFRASAGFRQNIHIARHFGSSSFINRSFSSMLRTERSLNSLVLDRSLGSTFSALYQTRGMPDTVEGTEQMLDALDVESITNQILMSDALRTKETCVRICNDMSMSCRIPCEMRLESGICRNK